MEDLKNKTLGFFMNYFSSLETWEKFGMFEREILLYNELAKKFKKIYIFSYGRKKELEYKKYLENNIEIVPKKYNLPDIVYEFLIPFIHRKLLKECDLYKTNQNSGAIAPAIAKILYRKKFIVRSGYIGSEFARLNKFPLYAKAYFWLAENVSYRFCDKAFIPAQMNFDTLLEKYPFLKNKLELMNNFVDTDRFKKMDAEKKYDIIYIGRFEKQKNHKLLLEAAKGLNFKILLIGQGSLKEDMIRLAKKNNVQAEFIDKVSNTEIPALYNSSKICAFPSSFEGNPKLLLEAMSCELPVAACNVVGVNNIITNDVSGLLSEPEPQKVKENILRLINDSALQERLGKSAREYILQNFSFKKLFEKEIEVYKKYLTIT